MTTNKEDLQLPSNLIFESRKGQQEALEKWGVEQGLSKEQIESWALSGENEHSYYYTQGSNDPLDNLNHFQILQIRKAGK